MQKGLPLKDRAKPTLGHLHLVGMARFERATSRIRSEPSSRLTYIPLVNRLCCQDANALLLGIMVDIDTLTDPVRMSYQVWPDLRSSYWVFVPTTGFEPASSRVLSAPPHHWERRQNWYTRVDSNHHCSVAETDVSTVGLRVHGNPLRNRTPSPTGWSRGRDHLARVMVEVTGIEPA